MSVKLLIEHNLEFRSLEGGCIGSTESTLVKMPHFWKSRVAAQLLLIVLALLIYFSSSMSIQAMILQKTQQTGKLQEMP